MTRRSLIALMAVFALTRMAGAWLADNPRVYRGSVSAIGDATLYRSWAHLVLDGDAGPYTDVRIEYPPGSLPFILAPDLIPGASYRTAFIGLMVLVDVAGFAGVLRISRRRGSTVGPWLWVTLVPLLGPVSYLRFDLVPAVATLWALERASARGWFGAGIWLGVGVVTKLYPAALVPAALTASSRRRWLAAGLAVPVVAAVLPFIAVPRSLVQSVAGYHLAREIEIESLWGTVLLIADRAGYPVDLRFSFESLNVVSPLSSALQLAAAVLGVAVILWSIWIAARTPPPQRERHLGALMFATLTSMVAVATVLSPQYILWLIPLAAVATSDPDSPVLRPSLLLAPVCVLTQAIYPFLFVQLARGEIVAVGALILRNLLLLGIGFGSLAVLHRSLARPREEIPPEDRPTRASA